MTEQDVLGRMDSGLLRVDPDRVSVEWYEPRHGRWYPKAVQYHPKSGRAKVVMGPRRQSFYMNRLVYMWVHRRVPPPVVDHADGNRHDDRAANLADHTRRDSDRQGYDRQQEKALARVGAWFDYIAEHGREPPTDDAFVKAFMQATGVE